jgi:hypothetical protein
MSSDALAKLSEELGPLTNHGGPLMHRPSALDISAHPDPSVRTRHLDQIELSRRWRISPRTLERWRWLNQGPAFLKIGGRVVYRLEDVEAYEEVQLRAPTPTADHFFQNVR